jgi:hypothetical protein
MSIQKKSLISNRTATKEAIVTKAEVSKFASTRLNKSHASIATLRVARVQTPHVSTKY